MPGHHMIITQVTRQILTATALIIGGCVALMVYGNHESPVLTVAQLLSLYQRPAYITYITLLAACALSSFLLYQYGRTRVECVCFVIPRWCFAFQVLCCVLQLLCLVFQLLCCAFQLLWLHMCCGA